jgi:hypothetical protein
MAGWLTVKATGFAELKKTFQDAPRKVKAVGAQWTRDVAKDAEPYIQREAPKKTGAFRKTIKVVGRDWMVYLHILPYGSLRYKLFGWIVEGTRPHIIRARNAKALHFYWVRRRHWYFFKSVNHPGTRANPFVERGLNKFQPRIRYWTAELGRRIAALF